MQVGLVANKHKGLLHMSEDFAPTRRQLFVGGAVLAAATLPVATPAMARAIETRPFADHDLADWQANIGKRFEVGADGATMKLVAVRGGATLPAGQRRRSTFTALFEIDATTAPEQGIHRVANDQLGQAPLYLERTLVKGATTRLRATFG